MSLRAVQVGEVVAEGHDFEEALRVLRLQLDDRAVLLLCNRFRRDAFVSSVSRQMSGGLRCYLVEPRRAVDPDKLVDCLGVADRSVVVAQREADEYIEGWKAWFEKPAVVRWLGVSLQPDNPPLA